MWKLGERLLPYSQVESLHVCTSGLGNMRTKPCTEKRVGWGNKKEE